MNETPTLDSWMEKRALQHEQRRRRKERMANQREQLKQKLKMVRGGKHPEVEHKPTPPGLLSDEERHRLMELYADVRKQRPVEVSAKQVAATMFSACLMALDKNLTADDALKVFRTEFERASAMRVELLSPVSD